MPTFSSRHFGPITYEDNATLEFPAGLPGFEQERRFLPVEHAASKPVVFLQSLTRPELCFITLPVRAVMREYRLSICRDDLRVLDLPCDRQPSIGDEVLCLAIVSVAEGRLPAANLLAPLVVNLTTRRGLQAIQEDTTYSHRHPLPLGQPEGECS